MFPHPDFDSDFETDASVRLELHCKTLLLSKFVAKKIFSPIRWESILLAWSATNSQIFTKSLRETIDSYNLELATLFKTEL